MELLAGHRVGPKSRLLGIGHRLTSSEVFSKNFMQGDTLAEGFTRASVATYVDSAGIIRSAAVNEARYDWETGRRALLLEDAVTNTCVYSEDFFNWGKENIAVVSDNAVAPSSELTADTLTESLDLGQHRAIRAGLSITAGETYTVSVFAKSSNRNLRITLFSGDAAWNAAAVVNLTTGVVSSIAGATVISAKVRAYPNGWYRLEVTSSVASTTTNAQVLYSMINNAEAVYAGDGVSTVALWGSQFELGTFATSYIKTGVATVTRAFDLATPSTLSDSVLAGGYVLLADFETFTPAGMFDRVLQLDRGAETYRQFIRYATGTVKLDCVVDDLAGNQALLSSTVDLTQRIKAAYAVGDNYFCGAVNGVAGPEDTSVIYNPPTNLRLAQSSGGAGRPKRIRLLNATLYEGRKTPAELAALTA